MERHGFVSKVHHKKPPHRDMPTRTRRSNAGKSVIRSRVEHVEGSKNCVLRAFRADHSRQGVI